MMKLPSYWGPDGLHFRLTRGLFWSFRCNDVTKEFRFHFPVLGQRKGKSVFSGFDGQQSRSEIPFRVYFRLETDDLYRIILTYLTVSYASLKLAILASIVASFHHGIRRAASSFHYTSRMRGIRKVTSRNQELEIHVAVDKAAASGNLCVTVGGARVEIAGGYSRFHAPI
ncbi:hypothetical protein TorRG33x02_188050 [Trema orientale]|uniref:Uncharacterized protein n=1 Tax=Trema orientale TaxID=63057 RepID=A0A2P5EIP4_TREOI|nr:hypothetical protein TorRG33x02_188050 [Trema orientale]